MYDIVWKGKLKKIIYDNNDSSLGREMNETKIFLELLKILNKEEDERFFSLVRENQITELQKLIVHFIKKYKTQLLYRF